jgi:hypothetical protein
LPPKPLVGAIHELPLPRVLESVTMVSIVRILQVATWVNYCFRAISIK